MKFDPCPFCGETNFDVSSKKLFKQLLKENGRACIRISCRNCRLDMYEHTDDVPYEEKLDLLKEKWNRRAK